MKETPYISIYNIYSIYIHIWKQHRVFFCVSLLLKHGFNTADGRNSCTTWDVKNNVNNGIFTISSGAGFLKNQQDGNTCFFVSSFFCQFVLRYQMGMRHRTYCTSKKIRVPMLLK